jgi:hypothetical protein
MMQGIDSLGGIMQNADNSKIEKPKKKFVVKAPNSIFASIIESTGLNPVAAETGLTAAISAAAEITLEERHHLISEAAYYRAERRCFAPGYELDDWLNAEYEIEMMLSKSGAENPGKNG